MKLGEAIRLERELLEVVKWVKVAYSHVDTPWRVLDLLKPAVKAWENELFRIQSSLDKVRVSIEVEVEK